MFRSTVLAGLIVLAVAAVPVSAGVIPSAPLADSLAPACAPACEEPATLQAGAATRDAEDMGVSALSTCSADCGSYSDVTCDEPGTCLAVDRDCDAGQRGYVVCNGVSEYCPVCEQECTPGEYRFVDTSQCCKPTAVYQIYQTCDETGHWENSGSSCRTVPFCPLF
jgi:hypothetical protein